MWKWDDGTELYHYGIKGQKWGIRNYQYEDGSLTPAGRERYGVGDGTRPASGNTVTSSRPHSRTKKVGLGTAQVKKGYSINNRKRADKFINSRIEMYTSGSQLGMGNRITIDGKKLWNDLPKDMQNEMLQFMTEAEAIELLKTQRALYYTRRDLTESTEGQNMTNEEYQATKEMLNAEIEKIEKQMAGYGKATKLRSAKKKKGIDMKTELN